MAPAGDRWKYFGVTHRDHLFCNPADEADVEALIAALNLPAGGRVLDVACGKGEFLCRLVERRGVSGVGVDLSPVCVAEARTKVRERGLEGRIEIVHGDGAAYEAPAGAFDLASCLGASWIWRGHRGTVRALRRWTRPGGFVVAGEPFWSRPPDPAYLAAAELRADEFADYEGNLRIAAEEGLEEVRSWVSQPPAWDRYEFLQVGAAESYAREEPLDPDSAEILARVRANWTVYVRWGRETLGWTLHLFRVPGRVAGAQAG